MKLSKGKIAKLYNKKHQSRRKNKKMRRNRQTFRNTKRPLNLATKTLKLRGGSKRGKVLNKIFSPITSGVKSLQKKVVASAKTGVNKVAKSKVVTTAKAGVENAQNKVANSNVVKSVKDGVKNAIQYFTSQSKNAGSYLYDKVQTDYYDKLLFGFKAFYMSEKSAWSEITDLSNNDFLNNDFLQNLTTKRLEKYEKMNIKSVFDFYDFYKKEVKAKLDNLDYEGLKKNLQELEISKNSALKPLFEKDAKYLTDLFYEKKFGLNVDIQKLEYLSDGQKDELFDKVKDDVTKNKIELDKIVDSGQDSVKKYDETMVEIGEFGELPVEFKDNVFLQKVYDVKEEGVDELDQMSGEVVNIPNNQTELKNDDVNDNNQNDNNQLAVVDVLNKNQNTNNNQQLVVYNMSNNQIVVKNQKCQSEGKNPKPPTNTSNYRQQFLFFHPDKNIGCKDDATKKSQQLNNLWNDFIKNPENKQLEIKEMIKDILKSEIIKQQIQLYLNVVENNQTEEKEKEFESQNEIFENAQIKIDRLDSELDNLINSVMQHSNDGIISYIKEDNSNNQLVNNKLIVENTPLHDEKLADQKTLEAAINLVSLVTSDEKKIIAEAEKHAERNHNTDNLVKKDTIVENTYYYPNETESLEIDKNIDEIIKKLNDETQTKINFEKTKELILNNLKFLRNPRLPHGLPPPPYLLQKLILLLLLLPKTFQPQMKNPK